MNTKYSLGFLVVTALPNWLNVTLEIETENPPFSLARNDGMGALQFSAAAHESGNVPVVTIETLEVLMADFQASRELTAGFDVALRTTPFLLCAQSFFSGMSFIRVWYCSNGRDIALVTYVCAKGSESRELAECERMVAALQFTELQPSNGATGDV